MINADLDSLTVHVRRLHSPMSNPADVIPFRQRRPHPLRSPVPSVAATYF